MESSSYEPIDRVEISAKFPKHRVCKWMIIVIVSIIIFFLGFTIGFFSNNTSSKSSSYEYFNDFGKLSQNLQSKIDLDFLKSQLNLLAAGIHQAGSKENYDLAKYVRKNWENWGLESSSIFKYPINKTAVLLSNPSSIRLIVDGTTVRKLTTVEFNGSLPLYHSYSIGGHARGRFVFVNYGLVADLKYIDSINVTICQSDVILIIRLGYSVRSAKMKTVMNKCGKNLPGGILIYPDPWDFSLNPTNKTATPANTPVYPNSWWLPGDAAVFGNMKMKSGLQNPDLPSMDAVWSTVGFEKMQTPIPVQPISYNDARELLKRADKFAVPSSWGNCLAKYIHSVDGVEIEMNITNQVEIATMTNVIGWIPGSVEKDRYVILGNHRDAWVNGASDPVSGTVILQQVAKVLGEAYKEGMFKPYRSVIFANWDGEEEGLMGSTEFTSQFQSDLLTHAIAYINMDCPIKGRWSFNGRTTPLMAGPMLESAKNVFMDKGSLFDDWLVKMPRLPNKTEPKTEFLGGGSDHINFAYVLGIPSAYPEYRYNESIANMPAYHTKYDTINMMLQYIDPGMVNHRIVSQFVTDYLVRLSYSPIVPYSLDRLVDLLLSAFADLKSTMDSVPFLKSTNYSRVISDQLVQLRQSVGTFNQALRTQPDLLSDWGQLRRVNDILLWLPRMFLVDEGLPTRPYLRNILLSTKLSNSYEGSVYTGVYDAVYLWHQGRVDLTVVLRQVSLLSNCLRRTIDLLNGGGLISIFNH